MRFHLIYLLVSRITSGWVIKMRYRLNHGYIKHVTWVKVMKVRYKIDDWLFLVVSICQVFFFVKYFNSFNSHIFFDNSIFDNSINFLFSFTDSSSRGSKKFGDQCDSTWECGFAHSICDKNIRKCQCDERFPATNHLDKCGKCKYYRKIMIFFSPTLSR